MLIGISAASVLAMAAWAVWASGKERRFAAADRPAPTVLNELQAAVQPAGTGPDSPNVWTFVNQAAKALDAVESEARSAPDAPKDSTDSPAFPDYTCVYTRPENLQRFTPEEVADQNVQRQMAERVLAHLSVSPVPDLLAKAVRAQYAVVDLSVSPGKPLLYLEMPWLGAARRLAKLNGARMKLALDHRDRDAFIAAYEANAALCRAMRPQPTIICGLVMAVLDRINVQMVVAAAAAGVPSDWYDAIEAADARQKSDIPLTHFITGERATCLDTIGVWFSLGPAAAGVDDNSPQDWSSVPNPGSYFENKAAINRVFDAFDRALAQERWQRQPSSFTSSSFTWSIPGIPGAAACWIPPIDRDLTSFDAMTLQHRGVRVVIALERFKAAKGHCPAALAELVPTFLSELPLDPYSGKPLAYRLNDPAADPEHRPYLLYSVGLDGVDDGGKDLPAAKIDPPRVTRSKILTDANFKGYDYIINSPE